MIMRSLVLRCVCFVVLLFGIVGSVFAQKSIRQVDFKNFTYPLSGSKLGHDRLQWLDVATKKHTRLVDGKNDEGFTLESVTFADVMGEGNDDAIVVLRWSSGGSQSTNYVYICSFIAGAPKIAAYFHSGDRAYSGLYKVYGEGRRLIVELNDPQKMAGDCCSSGFVRTRYRWVDGKFRMVGKREYGAVEISGAPSL